MTTKTELTGSSWTLLATAPTRVLLQPNGDIEVAISSSSPSEASGTYKVPSGEFADFVSVDTFTGNVYARANGLFATVSYNAA